MLISGPHWAIVHAFPMEAGTEEPGHETTTSEPGDPEIE
jgi:hypothetical protein